MATWTERQPAGAANKDWTAIASDNDGSHLIAAIENGRLYTSADFGVTWTERQPAGDADKNWQGVASDADGSNLMAAIGNGRLYTSADSGVTWTERQPAGDANKNWYRTASDFDGSHLIVTEGTAGRIYTSDDSGTSWTERRPAGDVGKFWKGAASNFDGSHLIVGAKGGRLYTSSNAGVTWTERQPAGDAIKDWRSAASDSDGSNLIVAIEGGRLYTSNDFGTLWVERRPAGDANKDWYAVASDSDGSHLIVGIDDGRLYISDDYGVTWTEAQPAGASDLYWDSVASDADGSHLIVGVYEGRLYTGVGAISDIVDKTYSKKLIAIGHNQVWYESSAGTMSVLMAANGQINTTDVLNAAVAFQKMFIANGTNLKVADFINTKIVTADVGTNPPDFGTIITGASGASMIVDYITSATADAASVIYGKRTTTITFVAGENVTGTNPSTSPYGAAVDFDMTAVAEVAPPHWYDYTVFGADATNYGVMPSVAYEICRYRGRIQLSGDPNYPHQWYQSRQFNPFDFLFVAGDAQSPVAGNNADATVVGDIIKVGIPYSDDYQVFGCATEIWVMSGDCAFGGEINPLDTTTGILGDRAWCWDDKGNLYMAGTAGLLRIPKGFGGIENLTIELWPDFITDLAFDSSLHRITLAFNPEEHGIHIFKTTLADGTCSGWWYDLRVEGLFPDAIPTAMGIYSAFYYQTENPSYRKLLVGCADGYIKSFDKATKNDDGTAINSYVGFAPLALSTHPRKDGIIKNIDLVSGGGGANGSQADSDDVTCTVHVARTAEGVLEKLSAGTTAAFTKIFSAPGWSKSGLDRRSIRGQWGTIVLTNNTDLESWSMERLIVDSKEIGRSL